MNQAEGMDLLCVGLHEINGPEESYGTECHKMNQDSFHETTKFDAVMATSAMYNDHSNANDCFDEYQHVGMMEGIQPVEEIRFGSMQRFELQTQGMVSLSEEERLSSSPETSSTSNSCMPGSMVENSRQIRNGLDEMADKEGPVTLKPDFVMCDTTAHSDPHLTFLPHGFKIEYLDHSREDNKIISLYWEISDIISIGCKWTQNVGSATITVLVKSGVEIINSGPVKVEFCIMDEQWPWKQQKIWHLASRYQEIWNNIPSDDFAQENWRIEPNLFFPKQYFSDTEDFEDYIYPNGEPDAVSISKRDVDLLLPETFVNDTIIDFYIKYLSTGIDPSEKCRYHFFNSFFFRKLADLDKDQGRAPEGRAAFLRVRKWTRKINLFEKDFVFIPVNFNLHWSLIVICYPGEVETFKDGDTGISAKVPCILHMDSLKGSHSGLKDIIQSYLWEEWKERHPETTSDNSDKFLNLRFASLELPQQDNSFDCGLFLLHYVELFLMDAPNCFNPLKIDECSSFLGDNWFPPAEASLKRSMIRKLIHGLLTGSFQNYPKLTFSKEQLHERHQRSENAEREPASVYLAQSCSAGEPDSLYTFLGMHQPSTSICLNDSEEKEVPASGCMLENEMVSMVAAQNLQELGLCPLDKDAPICLPSQDDKNEPPLVYTDNQFDSRSFAPEVSEVSMETGCLVKDVYAHGESLLGFPDKNQKISTLAEVEAHDTMNSKCCSISDNAEEVVVCQEHSLERNTNEVFKESGCVVKDEYSHDESLLGFQDKNPKIFSQAEVEMHSVMDSKCCSISENAEEAVACQEHFLERNTNEVDGHCGASEDMHSAMIFVSKDDIGPDPERITGEPEDVRCDLSEDTGSATIGDINKDVAEPSLEGNIVEAENIKREDTLVDPIVVEEVIKKDIIENNGTVDEINASEQYVSFELKEGNTDNGVITGCAFSSKLKGGNSVMAGDSTNGTDETHAVSENAYVNAVTGEAVLCEDGTTCTDSEMLLEDGTHSMKNETTSEHTARDSRRLLHRTCEITGEAGLCDDDTICTGAEMRLEDGSCNTDEIASENTACDAKRPLDSTCNITDEAVLCDDDTICTGAEMPLEDGPCSAKGETACENTACDAKRSLGSTCDITDEPVLCDDTICPGAEMPLEDSSCCAKDETASENTGRDVKRPLDSRCDITVEAVPCEDGTTCTDTEMSLVDVTCSAKSEAISENTASDARRQLPDSTCEENDTVVFDDKCLQKNSQSTDAKIERHYKRRKVLHSEVDKA